MIYSLIDGSPAIDAEHLDAASAIWDYAARSVAALFASTTANPLAEEIHAALVASGAMSRTDIRDLFNRNRPAADIDDALAALKRVRTGPAGQSRHRRTTRPALARHTPNQPEANKPGSRPKGATKTLQPQDAKCDRSVLTPAGVELPRQANNRNGPAAPLRGLSAPHASRRTTLQSLCRRSPPVLNPHVISITAKRVAQQPRTPADGVYIRSRAPAVRSFAYERQRQTGYGEGGKKDR